MTRSVSTKCLALCLALMTVLTGLVWLSPKASAAVDLSQLVVTLDPGHGGNEPGNTGAVQYGGDVEAVHTYDLCLKVKARLEASGVTVYLTRGANETISSNATRAAIAANHGSHVFLSIHTNAFSNSTANGIEILAPNDNYRPDIGAASRAAATTILNSLVSKTGLNSRGLLIKEGDGTYRYPDGSKSDYYGIIYYGKKQHIPLVMLIETGFASNQRDYETLLATDAKRQNTANIIADSLLDHIRSTGIPGGGGSGTGGSVSTTKVLNVSNDELRYLNASGGQIGAAFTPGAFSTWDRKLTIAEGSVATLADWGWAAFNANSFQYGYIVNGAENFSDSFTATTDADVAAAIASLGSTAKGSRFLGKLPTSSLRIGENNVKFCAKLNGTEIVTLREYTVIVEKHVDPAADGSYATFDFTDKTDAGLSTMLRVETHSGTIGNQVKVQSIDGAARFTATGDDPYVIFMSKGSDDLGITGTMARYILVKYRTEANSQSVMELAFYTNCGATQWGQDGSYLTAGIINDGEWNYILVDTGVAFGTQASTLQAFRMDVLDKAAYGETIDIATVKMFADKQVALTSLVELCVDGDEAAKDFLKEYAPNLLPKEDVTKPDDSDDETPDDPEEESTVLTDDSNETEATEETVQTEDSKPAETTGSTDETEATTSDNTQDTTPVSGADNAGCKAVLPTAAALAVTVLLGAAWVGKKRD